MSPIRTLAIRAAIALTCVAVWRVGDVAYAQLQITELMSDPGNEDAWEWIEVRNTGATPIDLNGYIIDRVGDPQSTNTFINGALSGNTVIPAGGIAVLYDADLTGPGDYNQQTFRTAWGLSPAVPLIGLPNFGNALTNGDGTAVGFWADAAAYSADIADDGTGTVRVAQLTNAAFGLDFRTESGFPGMSNGFSAAWNGAGSYQAPGNWTQSQAGVGGAATSGPASVFEQFNSSDDTANPGKLPAGPRASGVLITEIMYNPASPTVGSVERWEWVEILNNTLEPIDFSATPYYFDDIAGSDLTAPNVTSGVLPVGGVAVLFNDALTTQNLIDAWDPGGAAGLPFIPVANFSALNQGGDTIALWDSAAAYEADSTADRTVAGAIASVTYDDEGSTSNPTGWPNNMNKASIYLTDLLADPNVGTNWIDSFTGDLVGSVMAGVVSASVQIHAGGDVGSPGAFGVVVDHDADFDDDNDVDGADLLIWQRNVGVGNSPTTGDVDGSGTVDGADLAVWRAQFGGSAAPAAGAVPEPAALLLGGLSVLVGGLYCRTRPAK